MLRQIHWILKSILGDPQIEFHDWYFNLLNFSYDVDLSIISVEKRPSLNLGKGFAWPPGTLTDPLSLESVLVFVACSRLFVGGMGKKYYSLIRIQFRGSIEILHMNLDVVEPFQTLTGGHSATVRCLAYQNNVSWFTWLIYFFFLAFSNHQYL